MADPHPRAAYAGLKWTLIALIVGIMLGAACEVIEEVDIPTPKRDIFVHVHT